jgi:hypothetical protein
MKKLWFVRKTYGWGWTPVTWQGWLIIVVYTIGILKIFKNVDSQSHSGSDTLIGFALPFIILTSLLIAICYLKGEKPKWQWGNKK